MARRTILLVACLVLTGTQMAQAQRGRGGAGGASTSSGGSSAAGGTSTASQASPTAEAAANTAQARAYFQEGQAAYARGEYEQAIEAWRRAYELQPAPALQYNLAQAYGRLGDFPNELATLQAFVDTAQATDPNVPPARMRIDALRQRLARTGITLSGVSPDAEVRLDGVVVVPPTDGSVMAPEPGPHRIHVRRRGHRPFDAVVEVIPGRTTEVAVDQPAIEAPPAPVVGYSLLAGGGAMLAVGAATGVIGFLKAPDTFTGTPEGDRVHRLGLTTDVMLIGGAATAATGLVLVLLRDRPESDEYDASRMRVVPYASATGAGLAIDGRF